HRQAVALALLGTSRGIPAGMYRGEEDPMPIVVRSALRPSGTRGDRLSPDELSAADVPRPGASPVPLLQVASRDVRWEPAVIHRRDRSRAIHVRSQHADDVTYESIVAEARPRLERLDFPGGVTWEFGGVVADSAKANKALGANAPWAALLLIAILLAQFNSFRRTLIVLATAPLAALGIWPGLFIADLPFGFVALLGAIALIGIAVNGAIVLLDVADRRRREGATLEEALVEAVRLRTRPIVLTTATTVAGLVPLLFSQSTLWPPMAAAMISGLVVSTLLTLGVVPALYRLFFRPPKMPKAAVAAAVLAIAAPVAAQDSFDLEGSIHGDEPSVELSEAASRVVARSPQIEAAQATIRAAEAELRAVRVALAPRLTVGARYSRINRINNDPLVPGNDPEQSAAARRLAEGVDDPEARALFTGFLDQLDGLANTEIRVPRNQYALTAGVLFPVSSILAAVLPRYRGARQLVRVREAEERATRQGLELQTAEIFYALVRARSFRALSRHQRQRAQDQLTRVQAAVRAGSAPELDEVRMQGQVAAVEIALTQSDAAVAIASDAFQTLLGIEGDRSPAVELGTPPAASPVPLPQLVSRAYEARPEADALRAAVRAQRLVARGARADRYPVLALSANAQLANPNLNYVPVRDRFDSNWDVSVVLQWSPSDVGRGNAQAAAAEARAAEAVAHLRALEDGIRNEVTGAYHALRAASLSHQLAERGLRAAEATYRSTQRRWQEGSGPLGAVVDADAELTSAEVQQIDAALDAYVAAARLRFAVGESVSR
ncbi:MAG: efflux RND transporter permease subunit, partial [Myxococcota bacterium]